MKKPFLCRISAFFLALLLFAGLCVSGSAEEPLYWSKIQSCFPTDGSSILPVPDSEGNYTLILPACAKLRQLPLAVEVNKQGTVITAAGSRSAVVLTGENTLDLEALCGSEVNPTLRLTARRGNEILRCTLTILQTSADSVMYLTSDNPTEEGRIWVEDSADKTNSATGSMLLLDNNGTVVYDGGLTQIKGRGNSTWAGAKKPYQIKLSNKTDLLQSEDDDNASKTWVLLANYYDPTLLRNKLMLDLAAAMGMEAAMECRYTDLYYDGEYRGLYLLCEKVSVAKGRVNITDLESLNEDANPDFSEDEVQTATAVTPSGAAYVYCPAITAPEDVSGGYLLEMDYPARAAEETCYFTTSRNTCIVVKSPEYCSKAEMATISELYQQFEDALYNGGVNPTTGKTTAEYADMRSLAQWYLLNELSKNTDSYLSSTYFYKDAGSDLLKAGPIWDYDLSLGYGSEDTAEQVGQSEGWFALAQPFARQLYRHADFRETVKQLYTDTLYPLLSDVVLQDDATVSSDSLCSLIGYETQIDGSSACNAVLWPATYYGEQPQAEALKTPNAFLRDYLAERSEWLLEQYTGWTADDYTPLPAFLDVDEAAWYATAVNEAAALGLLSGTGHSLFLPAKTLTRAEAAQAAMTLLKGSGDNLTASFPDVKPTDWFFKAASWGAANKILYGNELGYFCPVNQLTRQDLVTIMYRCAGEPAANGTLTAKFIDSTDIQPYAREAVEWALELGILLGTDENKLLPLSDVSRAELAAILLRMTNYLQPTE